MKKRFTGEATVRFKLYKKGRHWLVMGTTVGLAWGGLVLSGQTAQAVTETASVTDESTQISGATATPQQVTLANAVHNTGDNGTSAVTSGSDTAETGMPTDPVTPVTATTNQAAKTNVGASSSVTPVQQVAEAESTMDIVGSYSSWGVLTGDVDTLVVTTRSQSATTAAPQVTDLGAADDTAFEAAKKVATANYQVLGQPQKVTAAAAAQPGTVLTLPKLFSIDTEGLAEGEVAKGMYGDANWVIKDDDTLHIYGEALLGEDNTTVTPQTLAAGDGQTVTLTNVSPWFDYRDEFDEIVIDEPVYLPENSSYLFAGLPDVMRFEGEELLIASDVTDFTGMFEGDTGLRQLDLSTWDTSKGIAFTDMFRLMDLNELTLGPKFTLAVDMPTNVAEVDGIPTEISFWVGVGEGSDMKPTGEMYVDGTYSGVATDADKFIQVQAPFDARINILFHDAETGFAVRPAEMLSGTVGQTGEYTVIAPDNTRLADGQAQTVTYTFTPLFHNVEILFTPTAVPAQRTDHISSIVQTEAGDVLAQTESLYQLSAMVLPARQNKIAEIQSSSFEPNTVTIPDGYEVAKITLVEAFQSTGRYAVVTVDKATDDLTATQYMVNQKTGVLEVVTPTHTNMSYEEVMKQSAVQDGNQYTVNQANINTLSMVKVGAVMPLNTKNMMIYTVQPLPETLTINYVDGVSNTVVKTADLTGMMAETGDYQVSVPDGYLLAPGQVKQVAYQFAADNTDDVTIKVLPEASTLVDDTTGDSQLTVRYVDGAGQVLAPETTQTGRIGQPLTVTAPMIAGYRLVPGQLTEATGTYQGNAMALTLTYETVPETPAETPIAGSVAEVAETPSTQVTLPTQQTEPVNEATTMSEPVIPQTNGEATANSEAILQPETLSEPIATVTENAQIEGKVTATSTQSVTQNNVAPTTDDHGQAPQMTLPQTNERSGMAAVLGMLVLGASWLWVTVLRKRN